MRLELTLEAAGERLDKALAEAHPAFSRSQWQRLIAEGSVTIDGQAVKASQRLQGGELVAVVVPPIQETELLPEFIPLDVRYEDEDILVVNKPAGMVVHPGVGQQRGTLVNAILAHCQDASTGLSTSLAGVGGERRPGIVHRLDKETSGLLVVAKNDQALRFLQSQFKRRTVEKLYIALVEGHPQPPQALIDAPIGRDPRQRKRMAVIHPGVSARSRPARTRYEVVGLYGDFALLECRPITGRTHQIRVHLAFIGHPIVGDKVYGRRRQQLALDRHFLHAAQLSFRRPTDGELLTLRAELPPELQAVLDLMRATDNR